VCDQFHEFQDLYNRCHQLERQAYRAIDREHKTAEKFDHAKREANLQKRLEHYEQAQQACEQAIERYDQLNLLLRLLRETLYLCSDSGRLRTVEHVRSDLTVLLSLIEEVDDEKLPKLLNPIRSHMDDILVPFHQVERIHRDLLELMPAHIVDAFSLAWHHDHLCYQSHSKKKHGHRRESQYWLNFCEGLLDKQFDEFKSLVFEKLGQVVKSSSLVEMVNSLIRPYLNSAKGQMTQETLNLIMFYHNHRRYRGGRRQGKAPMEMLTGEPLQGDWVDLLMQHKHEAAVEPRETSSPVLALVPNLSGSTSPPQTASVQVSCESGADANHPRQATGKKAA